MFDVRWFRISRTTRRFYIFRNPSLSRPRGIESTYRCSKVGEVATWEWRGRRICE
jgi:hypothetical protein